MRILAALAVTPLPRVLPATPTPRPVPQGATAARLATSRGAADGHCPEDDPQMKQAWADCLMWAAGQEDIRAQFEADTGEKLPRARTALDRMIDEATGFGDHVAAEFVAWFNANIWGHTK